MTDIGGTGNGNTLRDSGKYKVAICEDEGAVREALEEKVREAVPAGAVRKFSSGEELLGSGFQPDILFLDIQMPGMDGMETARCFRAKNRDAVLIFVTAVEEYVFQAFDVGAFHYLVKPFSDEKLREVAASAVRTLQARKKREDASERTIIVKAGGSHRKISLKTIVYAEVFNRKIVLHTIEGEVEYYGKLKELEQIAGEDFFRSHRAYLVNMAYIRSYSASSITAGGTKVLMAKQKYPEFIKRFMKYNQRNWE